MSKLRDELIGIIAQGVPISAHCPDCDRIIAEETVIDLGKFSNKLWDNLIKEILVAIVVQLKEDIK